MISVVLIAAASVTDVDRTQRQLDFIVSSCRADNVVRFVAHQGNKVSFDMLKPGLPSVSENQAFQCALDKVKARSDLHLGSAGNEAKLRVQER